MALPFEAEARAMLAGRVRAAEDFRPLDSDQVDRFAVTLGFAWWGAQLWRCTTVFRRTSPQSKVDWDAVGGSRVNTGSPSYEGFSPCSGSLLSGIGDVSDKGVYVHWAAFQIPARVSRLVLADGRAKPANSSGIALVAWIDSMPHSSTRVALHYSDEKWPASSIELGGASAQ